MHYAPCYQDSVIIYDNIISYIIIILYYIMERKTSDHPVFEIEKNYQFDSSL